MLDIQLHRGDQVYIYVPITLNEQYVITPDMCIGVKVKIGKLQKSYPNGGLTFDSEYQKWVFPITQQETLDIKGRFKAQCQVNFGGTPNVILGAEIQRTKMFNSIIDELWSDENER